jgi:hypothetical protein
MAEIDIRDRDILEAKFNSLSENFEKLSEEIIGILNTEDRYNYLENLKYLKGMITTIEES